MKIVLITVLGAAMGTSLMASERVFYSGAGVEQRTPMELPEVEVEDVIAAGSGCPGLADPEVELSLDGSGLILGIGYEDVFAERGEGIPRRDMRKFCQHSIVLDYDSEEWSFAVATVASTAFVDMEEEGMVATLSSTIYFQGSDERATVKNSFYGPDFSLLDYYGDFDELTFSPCGEKRNLNVKNAAVIKAPRSIQAYGGAGFDHHVKLELVWKKCSEEEFYTEF